jgi:hypothetical protein
MGDSAFRGNALLSALRSNDRSHDRPSCSPSPGSTLYLSIRLQFVMPCWNVMKLQGPWSSRSSEVNAQKLASSPYPGSDTDAHRREGQLRASNPVRRAYETPPRTLEISSSPSEDCTNIQLSCQWLNYLFQLGKWVLCRSIVCRHFGAVDAKPGLLCRGKNQTSRTPAQHLGHGEILT